MTQQEINQRVEKAVALFKKGFNCSQSVFTACADLYGIEDERLALRLSASFGGGIGRNSADVRSQALEGLECLGIILDEDKNRTAKGGDDISKDGSLVRIYVVDTNEEIIVARKALSLLESK